MDTAGILGLPADDVLAVLLLLGHQLWHSLKEKTTIKGSYYYACTCKIAVFLNKATMLCLGIVLENFTKTFFRLMTLAINYYNFIDTNGVVKFHTVN